MTLDARPVSLDALSAEDGAAVALAVSQAARANTRRAYRQQWAAFTTWASAQGYPSLPAADATLAAYLTLLAGQGLALASVRQARGAVVKAHQLAGFPYLTESEHQALTWAAGRARRRPSDAIRLVAIDWANSQVERANQERGPA